MSEAALAPKVGPVTEEERATFEKWVSAAYQDVPLAVSLYRQPSKRPAAYLFVRALRAGAKLEDLL